MSYDIQFLRPQDLDDLDAAMEAMEANAAEERMPAAEDLALWDRIEDRLRGTGVAFERFDGESHRELTDGERGIQIGLHPGEIWMSVPYWYGGDEAEEISATLRELARAIEDGSGLVAFDPQTGMRFLDEGNDPAVAMNHVHDRLPDIIAAAEDQRPTPPAEPPSRGGALKRLFRRG